MKLRPALAVLALALPLTPLGAPLLAASHPLTALLIRDFFSCVCHQNPVRSFVVEGSALAVCVRCLGIYCGVALGALARLKAAAWLMAIALLLNVLDAATEALHWHGNLPWPRFLLGLLVGMGVGGLLSWRRADGTRGEGRFNFSDSLFRSRKG